MRTSFWFLPILLLLTSCSSKPEDLIVGSWKFDKMQQTTTNGTPSNPMSQQLVDALWSRVHMRFSRDGTCEVGIGSSGAPQKSRYQFENNGRTIVMFEPNGTENRLEIVKLTRSELVFQDEGGEVGFVKE